MLCISDDTGRGGGIMAAEGNAAGGSAEVQDDLEHHRMTAAAQVAALEALEFNWGDAYEIGCDDGEWWFGRRDGIGGRERASAPDELRRMIVADYEFRPVRKDGLR
jgi:hypothetical protein